MQPQTIDSFFGEKTGKFYKLYSTPDLPCLEISGVRMHCTDAGVKASTQAMVKQLQPLVGVVLDTCAGLGYTATALALARRVEKVFTFEVDSNVIEIAKRNPFSRDLFENKKILLQNRDVSEAIKEFPDNFFDQILHDPPRFSLAGELYGRQFYAQLFRVLKKGGILFHYTGEPGGKKGRDLPGAVMRRLQESGFLQTKRVSEAQGIRAIKK